jgi:hypothetical protein
MSEASSLPSEVSILDVTDEVSSMISLSAL